MSAIVPPNSDAVPSPHHNCLGLLQLLVAGPQLRLQLRHAGPQRSALDLSAVGGGGLQPPHRRTQGADLRSGAEQPKGEPYELLQRR